MTTMQRVYECPNPDCSDYAVRVVVRGEPLDAGLWAFPDVACSCGWHATLIGTLQGGRIATLPTTVET